MVNFDNVLRHIGEFGKAQILFYFLIGLCGIPTGQQNVASVFIAASQDHWCSVPALENLPVALRKNLSIPRTSSGGFEKCERFDIDFGNASDVWDDPKFQWGNSTGRRHCNSWEFDRSEIYSTVASQFNLVCQHSYAANLVTSVYMSGFLVGSTVCGLISDKIGRMRTVVATTAAQTVFSLLAALVPSLVVHAVCRFLVAACTSGTFTTVFVISMEMIGPKYRMQPGIFMQEFIAVGIVLVAGLAYFIRNHIMLQLVLALHPVVFISYYWFFPESPRWLASQGRYKEATEICKRIARINGRELPENFSIKEMNLSEKLLKATTTETVNTRGNILDLMRLPRVRWRFFNLFFGWFVTSLMYYNLSLNVGNLGGNLYVNMMLIGLVELPSYIVCCFTLNQFGRVKMLAILQLLSGAACVAVGFIELLWLKITIAMIGKFAISGAYAIIFVYSAEVFPTVIRNAGVGLSSMCARIGGLLAPQVVLLSPIWQPLPFVLVGVLCLSVGFLSLLLPETLNEPLPETIEDGEQFGRKTWTSAQQEMEACGPEKVVQL